MTRKTFNSIALLILLAAGSLGVLMNIGQIWTGFLTLISVFTPLFLGVCFAFVLNGPFLKLHKIYMDVLPKNEKWQRRAKGLAILSAYILLLGLIVLVFAFMLPEIVRSFRTLAGNFGGYIENAQGFLAWVIREFGFENIDQAQLLEMLNGLYEGVLSGVTSAIPTIFSWTQSIVQVVMNIVVGLTISVYMLVDKEHLLSIVHRMLHAYLPLRISRKIEDVGEIANEVFSSFVTGQMLEALILGVMCFIGMTIFRFPYAPLISFIIGVTNFIPYIGPILGTIPGALIIVMIDPLQAVWFVAMVIVIQQIDNNLVYPRVVGSQVGLPAMWVLLAVMVSGSLFGIGGMLLAVPTVSVIYQLVRADTARRLDEKAQRQKEAEKNKL